MTQWMLPPADTYFAQMLARDPRGFEIDHLDLALRHCERFRLAVDGGAHIGTWSVEMAKRFESVMAFEPARDTYDCLRENVQGCENIVPIRKALGAEAGTAFVVDDPTRTGNTGARHLGEAAAGGASVEVVPLDDYDFADLDFLKLDVEGYELNALKGAGGTLTRCQPVVLIEAKRFRPERFGVDAEAASRFLQSMGYRQVAAARNDRVFKFKG